MSAGQASLALALLLGLQPVATDLYLPALPLLAADLKAPLSAVQMTMSALLLSFGFSQLLMGPMSDRWGRRPVLLWGLALFAWASLAAAAAPDIHSLIAARAGQGAGLAASVVCARAMVRDLYLPHEGARVMSRALTGLGVIAFMAPTLGGVLAAAAGWRWALGLVCAIGLGVALFVGRRVPETALQLNPRALAPGPLWQAYASVGAHPSFRAWAALIAGSYAGLFVLLSTSAFVYMGFFGLSPWLYGLLMASASVAYVLGTFHCRRLLLRVGLVRAVRWGGAFTLVGGLGLWALSQRAAPPLAGVVLAHWVFMWGHGIHQPCGQSGAVGPFPQQAGVASALSGFLLAVTAFGTGLWLGQHMEGGLAATATALAVSAIVTATVAWTLVQRHGEHFGPAAAATP
jgi:DHA1 family bicyclomycin/chloramphenicol resistance-like MFS transporter